MRAVFILLLAVVGGSLFAAEPVTLAFTVEAPAAEASFLRIYADAGFAPTALHVPGARAIRMIDDGLASGFLYPDSVISKTFKTKVTRLGYGDQPLARVAMVVWVRSQDKARLTDPAAWAGVTIGSALSSPGARQVTESLGLKPTVSAPDAGKAGRMLSVGRFDLIILPVGLLNAFTDPRPLGITTLDRPAAVIPYWHVLPASWAGTPAEAALRASFLRHRDELDRAIADFVRR